MTLTSVRRLSPLVLVAVLGLIAAVPLLALAQSAPPADDTGWVPTAVGVGGAALGVGGIGTGALGWWLRGVVAQIVEHGLPIAVRVEVSVSEQTMKAASAMLADHDEVVRLRAITESLEDEVGNLRRRQHDLANAVHAELGRDLTDPPTLDRGQRRA